MCLATVTDDYLIKTTLKRCQMSEYFSKIFICTSVGSGKDKSYIYREAFAYLDTEKSKTVVFEDAAYMLKTATKDGFITAAVYDRYEKNQEGIKVFSDFYIIDYSELESFGNSSQRYNLMASSGRPGAPLSAAQ